MDYGPLGWLEVVQKLHVRLRIQDVKELWGVVLAPEKNITLTTLRKHWRARTKVTSQQCTLCAGCSVGELSLRGRLIGY